MPEPTTTPAPSGKPEGEPRLLPPPCAPMMAIDSDWLNRLAVPRGSFFDDFFGANAPAPFDVIGSTAVVTISGSLDQRASWFWQGYDEILESFEAALADRSTDAVLLRIDSPGGVCAGCFACVDQMLAARAASSKPVLAYADEKAYSAAYALACVADQIWLPASGGVGSVGVIGAYSDITKALDMAGVRVAVVASGNRKTDSHPAVALTDAAIERLRTEVTYLAGIFFDSVAKSRLMTVERVKALQAGTFLGKAAVDVELADHVGSFEEARAALETMAAKRSNSSGAKAAHEDNSMSNDKKTPAGDTNTAAHEAGPTLVPMITVSEHEAAIGAVRSERDTATTALQSTIREQAASIKRLGEEKAALEARVTELDGGRLEAAIESFVGVKITEASKADWLETARANEARALKMLGDLPDLGALGPKIITDKGNEARATDGVDANTQRINSLTTERMKTSGESRANAMRAVMQEHPELCEDAG